MNRFLLDTNVIVDLLRGKSTIDISILEKGAAISIITLSELYYGANKSNNVKKHLIQIENIINDLDLSLIDFDKEASNVYGKIKSDLEKKGNRLEDIDLFIASTAISEGLTLVTSNLKHFKRIKECVLIPPTK